MFCPYCGKQLADIADICVGCGHSVRQITKNAQTDSASAGWWWLGFFFPIIGFVLWAVWTGEYPKKAKKALTGSLVGIIASVVGIILFWVIYIVVLFSLPFLFY